MPATVELADAPTPLSPEDFASIRSHPLFRQTVRKHVATNLAHYAGLNAIGRWMMSDLGRAALSYGAVALSAMPGGLTLANLTASAAMTGAASRARVRLYMDRAVANGLIGAAEPGAAITAETPLALSDTFMRIASQALYVGLPSSAVIAPEALPAVALLDDNGFRRRMGNYMGLLALTRPDLFPGAGAPVHVFQSRDGGMRMLEDLILRQPEGEGPLLSSCDLSRSALARASFCSRRHVARLIQDGQELGLMQLDGGRLTISRELSDDVELYYARLYAVCRTGGIAMMAG